MSTTQENVKTVRQIFDAWNGHDPERLVKLLDEKYVSESDTHQATLTGRESARQFMMLYVKAFPDLHIDVAQILAMAISSWRAGRPPARTAEISWASRRRTAAPSRTAARWSRSRTARQRTSGSTGTPAIS